ncbi:cupin domain-containing protein [Neotabrizicola sp. VNH66]|uniref:cupin domain-containing protein n=1 Tax=Neotabrizicola sp. VNH66 TaxID=3400918 RepID=UPI003BFBF1A2
MTHPLILRVTRDGVTPTIEGPAPEAVVSGNSVHTTWSLEETEDGLYSGLWQATPGKWRLTYAEWEYVYIHEGHSILTDADGVETHLKAGDSYIIRPGYSGTWEVVETTLKDYVIKT